MTAIFVILFSILLTNHLIKKIKYNQTGAVSVIDLLFHNKNLQANSSIIHNIVYNLFRIFQTYYKLSLL